jgi:hypothetical protein
MADQLDIFGFDVDQLEDVKIDNPTTLSQVFNNIAADMVYCLQQSVKKEGLVYKGSLGDSIRMPVKMFGFRMIATLYLADYYDYLNQGVKGIGGTRKYEKGVKLKSPKPWVIKAPNSPYQFKRGPSVSHIKAWAKSKGLNEYAVRNSIARTGIKPRYFFDNCMKETFYGEAFNKFKTDIRIVSGERIAKGLQEILKK